MGFSSYFLFWIRNNRALLIQGGWKTKKGIMGLYDWRKGRGVVGASLGSIFGLSFKMIASKRSLYFSQKNYNQVHHVACFLFLIFLQVYLFYNCRWSTVWATKQFIVHIHWKSYNPKANFTPQSKSNTFESMISFSFFSFIRKLLSLCQ